MSTPASSSEPFSGLVWLSARRTLGTSRLTKDAGRVGNDCYRLRASVDGHIVGVRVGEAVAPCPIALSNSVCDGTARATDVFLGLVRRKIVYQATGAKAREAKSLNGRPTNTRNVEYIASSQAI